MRSNALTLGSSFSMPRRRRREARDPYDGLRPWSAITHGVGAALAALGTGILLAQAIRRESTLLFFVFLVYGLSMTGLYTASTLYHSLNLSVPGRIALRKRAETGLLAGLWEFPHVPGELEEAIAAAPVEAWGLSAGNWQQKLTAKHIFTHREWHMTGYALRVTGAGPADFVWVDGTELANHAVPSAFARYYEEAREILKRDFPEKENG